MNTSKLNLGLLVGGVVIMLLTVPLSLVATSAVQGTVDGLTVRTAENTWESEDWLTSVSYRDYYANGVTNGEALNDFPGGWGIDPIFEPAGPFTYKMTTTRIFIEHNSTAGTYEYSESTVYESCFANPDCEGHGPGEDPNSLATNLNIPYATLRVAALPVAFQMVRDGSEAGFAKKMLENDMSAIAPGLAVVSDIEDILDNDNFTQTMLGILLASGFYQEWNTSFSMIYGATLDNGEPTNDTWPEADFSDGIDQALHNMSDGGGNDISLTSRWGVPLFLSHGSPEAMISDIVADINSSTSLARALTYGYAAYDAEGNVSIPQTYSRDWAMYAGLAGMYDGYDSAMGDLARVNTLIGLAADDSSWFTDNASFSDLFARGDGTDDPQGLLAEGEEPIYFGISWFVDTAQADSSSTMTSFGITDTTAFDSLLSWAGGWLNNESRIPTIMVGSDDGAAISAGDYANISFGGIDPLTGDMPLFSMNHAGFAPVPNDAVIDMGNERGGALLDQMTDITGAAGVVYISITGVTPPRVGSDFGAGGIELSKVLGLTGGYDVDYPESVALEHFTMSVLYNDLVPRYLRDIGADRWATHSVNEWLFGWHDSAAAFALAGDAEDYTSGWFSLDTNASYYVTPELAALNVTGPENEPGIYVRNTGEHDITQVGRLVLQDGKTELDWHSEEMYIGTYGLISWERNGLLGTSGGWIDGTDVSCTSDPTVKYNLGGYVIADIPCVGTADVKGIETVHYRIATDPLDRNIQAKLLNSKTLLDALPGSIPIYFGAEVDLYADPVTGAIIKGDVTSSFYLDIAALNDPGKDAPVSIADMEPVFVIEDNPELSDDVAATIQSQIYQNMDLMSWWMNFDTPFDMLVPILLVVGIALAGFGGIRLKNEMESTPGISEESSEQGDD